MRRKKSEVDVTKQTLAQEDQGVTLEPKHHAAPARQTGPVAVTSTSVSQTLSPVTDGVIDLDPEPTRIPLATAIANGSAVELSIPKTKRKYTKRKKADGGGTFTPTLVDLGAIRDARIQAFTAYVDGKDEFDHAAALDDQLKKLHDLGKEIAARQIKA